MANTADIDSQVLAEDQAPRRGFGLIIGLALMLILGAGGFYAAYSGLLPIPGGEAKKASAHKPADLPAIAFVPIEELVISLSARARAQHLVFEAQLEVAPEYKAEVELLMPRILDVLNTYLRAVEERDIAEPSSMPRLRAQMLRRVQIVTGQGRVRDLLITRFLLN